MVNIEYEYRKEDSLGIALQKVIRVLLKRQVAVFDLLADSISEIEISFLKYATEHQQCNVENNAHLVGLPIFTRCADATHSPADIAEKPSKIRFEDGPKIYLPLLSNALACRLKRLSGIPASLNDPNSPHRD